MNTTTATFQRTLGRSGIKVSPMGLGCWAIGGTWYWLDGPGGWGDIDDNESVRAIHAALTTGRIAPWDYAPRTEAAASYYRNYDSARPDPDRLLRRPRPAG